MGVYPSFKVIKGPFHLPDNFLGKRMNAPSFHSALLTNSCLPRNIFTCAAGCCQSDYPSNEIQRVEQGDHLSGYVENGLRNISGSPLNLPLLERTQCTKVVQNLSI